MGFLSANVLRKGGRKEEEKVYVNDYDKVVQYLEGGSKWMGGFISDRLGIVSVIGVV